MLFIHFSAEESPSRRVFWCQYDFGSAEERAKVYSDLLHKTFLNKRGIKKKKKKCILEHDINKLHKI